MRDDYVREDKKLRSAPCVAHWHMVVWRTQALNSGQRFGLDHHAIKCFLFLKAQSSKKQGKTRCGWKMQPVPASLPNRSKGQVKVPRCQRQCHLPKCQRCQGAKVPGSLRKKSAKVPAAPKSQKATSSLSQDLPSPSEMLSTDSLCGDAFHSVLSPTSGRGGEQQLQSLWASDRWPPGGAKMHFKGGYKNAQEDSGG